MNRLTSAFLAEKSVAIGFRLVSDGFAGVFVLVLFRGSFSYLIGTSSGFYNSPVR